MKKHQQMLASTVTIGAALPQTGPFAQRIVSRRAPTDGLIDAEIDLNVALCACLVQVWMDGGDLADEDDGSLIGHSVQNVFDAVRGSGLRGGEWGCQQCRKKRLRDDFDHPVHGLSAALSTAGALKCSDGSISEQAFESTPPRGTSIVSLFLSATYEIGTRAKS